LNEILCFIVIVQSSKSSNPLICYYDTYDVLLWLLGSFVWSTQRKPHT